MVLVSNALLVVSRMCPFLLPKCPVTPLTAAAPLVLPILMNTTMAGFLPVKPRLGPLLPLVLLHRLITPLTTTPEILRPSPVPRSPILLCSLLETPTVTLQLMLDLTNRLLKLLKKLLLMRWKPVRKRPSPVLKLACDPPRL